MIRYFFHKDDDDSFVFVMFSQNSKTEKIFGRQVPRFFIRYDDGDKGWVNCHQVRLLPQRTDQGGCGSG